MGDNNGVEFDGALIAAYTLLEAWREKDKDRAYIVAKREDEWSVSLFENPHEIPMDESGKDFLAIVKSMIGNWDRWVAVPGE